MRERFRALDPRLLWVLLALIALGTLTLFSAGRNTPSQGSGSSRASGTSWA